VIIPKRLVSGMPFWVDHVVRYVEMKIVGIFVESIYIKIDL